MITAATSSLSPITSLGFEDLAQPAIERTSPLASPGHGTAILPAEAQLTLTSSGPSADFLAIERTKIGNVQIDLGDGYRLGIDDHKQSVVLDNNISGARTVIFGDARIETPDGDPLQFWGTTSLTFGDDAKLTLQTIADPEEQGAYRLDKITITNGNKAAIITGLADDATDNLSIKTAGGYATDEKIRDGFILEEKADGFGWQDEGGEDITQDLLNATAVGAAYGPGSKALSLGELSVMVSRFLQSVISFGNIVNSFSSRKQEMPRDTISDDRRSEDRSRLERLLAEQAQIKFQQIQDDLYQ
jgi:Domain of Unknown Function (DUF1521)